MTPTTPTDGTIITSGCRAAVKGSHGAKGKRTPKRAKPIPALDDHVIPAKMPPDAVSRSVWHVTLRTALWFGATRSLGQAGRSFGGETPPDQCPGYGQASADGRKVSIGVLVAVSVNHPRTAIRE